MLTKQFQSNRKRAVTQQTLAEQLQVTDREIAYRKALLAFKEDDVQALRDAGRHVLPQIQVIVDEFYQGQVNVPEIALLIGDAETLGRLQSSMMGYIAELFQGVYDADYVNKRLRIGKVHKRIGVSPKLYISAVVLLESIVTKYLWGANEEVQYVENEDVRRRALKKLLMLDIQFVFDTYISSLVAEVDAAKVIAEEHAESLEDIVAQRTSQLEELSRTDPLTGLQNLRSFKENLIREIAAAKRHARPLSLIFFDLDNFKAFNDTRGHRSGDEILVDIGKLILNEVRADDTACRYGGDEFALILPSTSLQQAEAFACRFVESLDKLTNIGDIRCSIGIAGAGPSDFCEPDALVHLADEQMYIAKSTKGVSNVSRISVAVPANTVDASSSPGTVQDRIAAASAVGR